MPENSVAKSAIFWIIFSFGIVSVSSSATAQEAESAAPTVDSLEREFARAAVVNRWREDRDLVTPILMLKAAAMSKAGFGREEIVTELSTRRAEWEAEQGTGLRADWEVDEDYRILIRHGGALAGLAARSGVGVDLSAVSGAAADIGILTYEQFARDGEVQEASRQLGLRYDTVRRSEDQIAGLVADVYSENDLFRQIYDEQFASTIGFRPTDSMEAISESYPEFASQNGVRTLVDILTRNDGDSARVALTDAERGALQTYLQNSLGELRADNAARIGSLAAQNAQGIDLLQELALSATRRRDLERQRAEERVVFEGRRAGAFLATTALGLLEPEVGRQAEGVVSAAVEINRSIEAFDAASKLGEEFAGSASLALTGNLVGSALSLVGVFSDSGPTPEELILQEIAALRRDIANLRVEMHERFDAVDARLDEIYERLDDGLRDLEAELQRTTKRSLLAIRESLVEIEARQATATSLLLNRTDLILARMSDDLAPCLDNRNMTALPLTKVEFRDCTLTLGRGVRRERLREAQVPADQASDPATFVQLLRDSPNKVAGLSYDRFATESGEQYPEAIVGPLDWVYAAESYLGFVDEWPEHRGVITAFEHDRVKIEGEKISNAIRDIQSGLIAYSSGLPSPALDHLLASFSGYETLLGERVALYEGEYYSKKLERPLLNLIGDERMVPRPVGMSPDLRDWRKGGCLHFNRHGALAPPVDHNRYLPPVVREAVDLGIGTLRYCLQMHYDQPAGLVSMRNDKPGQSVISQVMDENVYYTELGPGPLTMRLTIEYVLGSLKCPALPIVFDAQVVDTTKSAGAHGVAAPAAAPALWNDHWQGRFIAAVAAGGKEVTVWDRWGPVQQCVEAAVVPAIDSKLSEFLPGLSADMYEQFETDAEIAAGDEQIEAASALLSHWMWMGYSDRLQRSDILASLASGAMRPPTLTKAIDAAEREGKYPWEAIDIYRNELAAFLEVLQSQRMADVLAEPGDSFGIQAILARVSAP